MRNHTTILTLIASTLFACPALPSDSESQCSALSAPFAFGDSERQIRDTFLLGVCGGANADIQYVDNPAFKGRVKTIPGRHPVRGNVYSDAARKQRLEGDILIAVVVEEDGSVKHAVVIKSTGHTLLDDNAVDWVKNQTFPQYTLDEKPVRMMFYLPMKLHLTH